MEFEWDKIKNQSNIKKHRLSFERAIEIFDSYVLTLDGHSKDQEKRQMSIGFLETTVITVIHTQRNNNIRIVSARKASRKERRIYDEYLKRTGITAA